MGVDKEVPAKMYLKDICVLACLPFKGFLHEKPPKVPFPQVGRKMFFVSLA